LGDIDPDDYRKFLNGVGYAEREPPQHYSHGYGQWWDSPAGGPAFIPWNPSTNKVAGAAICEVAHDLPPGTGHSARESWLLIVPVVGAGVISAGACPW